MQLTPINTPMKKLTLYPTLLLATFVSAHAADWTGNTDGNWNVDTNWSGVTAGDGVPGSGEVAFIRITDTVYQNAQTREVGRIAMGINSETPTLNVGQNGGSITTGVGTSTQNNFGQNTSGTTTFNLLGGAFTASNTTIIGAGSGNMDFNVHAGALTLGFFQVSGNGGTAFFDILGSAATLVQGNGSTFASGATLNFEFDAAGVTQLDVTYLNADGATLLVDLSNYAGPTGTFTIVDANRDNQGQEFNSVFSTVTVTEGVYAGSYVTQDQVNDVITVTVIPEPSTCGLLVGMLTLAVVSVRRR